MDVDSSRMARLIEVARGDEPADLCIRHCRLVNVLSGRVETVDIAVCDGWVAGFGEYGKAREEIDAGGMYVCPGFIDGHIHIESTLLSPDRFSSAVVPGGTSAVVADPHEIANVLGMEGIRYFLDASEGLPLDIFFNLPSCVPASPLETSGAQLGGADLLTLADHPRVLGLAEMMNFPGVVAAFPDVLEKLVLFRKKVLDGHSPQLSGLALNAYLTPGIASDHECTTAAEANEKLAKGMRIMIREGSQSKDLEHLLPIVNDHTWPQCMFVSDDRHPDDLLRDGHMNAIVNRAMDLGMDPVRAVTLATLTPARYFGLARRGAVAPGYKADFSISPTLKPWDPVRVFLSGREAARDGVAIAAGEPAAGAGERGCPAFPASPMNLSRISGEDLRVPVQPGRVRVIDLQEGSLLTGELLLEPAVEKGYAVADPERDILKLAVYNRYEPGKPPCVGFIHGLGIRKGAIATTVAHDSHNLVVAGASDSQILRVVEEVRRHGGGMAVCDEDGPVEMLPLPIAGLMSDQPLQTVVERLDRLKSRARSLGSQLHNPFMALSFVALPVIPRLKITDRGLVDVFAFAFVPLFE